jgi:tryptophan synthase alpha chain
MTALLEHCRERLVGGRKLLVPYLMGGLPERSAHLDAVRAIATHADAVEIGLPYSDPLMDGPMIAAAAERAIRAGIGPLDALDLVADLELGVPRIAMTYYNPIHHLGEADFCKRAVGAGFGGLIVPDIPHEESESLRSAAADTGLAWIPLVAPTSSQKRADAICATATGFVYAVSTLGVTGTRDDLSERAAQVVELCRSATDVPILVGIGVSSPLHAQAATDSADGVVIGSAVVRLVLEEGAAAAEAFLGEVRAALDA